MIITLDYLAKAWEKYNVQYFDGALRKPRFKIDNSKRRMGCYHPSECMISISKYYERTEKQYDTTIIHEMIHQYIRQNNIRDTSAHHGKVFKSIAARINMDGWNIQTRTGCDEIGVVTKNNVTYHVFCLYIRHRNKYMTIVVNPNYLMEYKSKLGLKYPMCKYKESTNPKYGKYPQCRGGVRGFWTTKEEYENFFIETK